MSDAILIFTFGPIQSFIAEARRTADLFVGSQILVRLANAVTDSARQHGQVIYPPEADTQDAPNVLVALVPMNEADTIAEKAELALQAEWELIAQTARQTLTAHSPPLDKRWEAIWNRQIGHQWETAWAAASVEGRSYDDAYQEARATLDATRCSRFFSAAEEDGLKDSLSGSRSALRTATGDARQYWAGVRRSAGAVRLRPNERLDAVGAVKRFGVNQPFPSTSDIATRDYVTRVSQEAPDALRRYRQTLTDVLGNCLPDVRSDSDPWPKGYDGDLLYLSTLTLKRLSDDYDCADLESERLEVVRRALQKLHGQVGSPSTYYAILVIDGDNMGDHVRRCQTADEHRAFSQTLSGFSATVRPSASHHQAEVIYNGGDDVLAFAPMSTALALAAEMQVKFGTLVHGTVSAGIALVHHNYPLGAALRAARLAEQHAKRHVNGKAAVCIRAVRRSGETLEVHSPWATLNGLSDVLVDHFKSHRLAAKLAYETAHEAEIVTALNASARLASLRRLIQRHTRTNPPPPASFAAALANQLGTWATTLDACLPPEPISNTPIGLQEVGRWLVLARFLAQGGEAA